MNEYFKLLSPKIRSVIDPNSFYVSEETPENYLDLEIPEDNIELKALTNSRLELIYDQDYVFVDARNTKNKNTDKAKKLLVFTKNGTDKIYGRLSDIFYLLKFRHDPNITANKIVRYIMKCNPEIISFSLVIRSVIVCCLTEKPSNTVKIIKTPIKIENLELVSKFSLDFFQAFKDSQYYSLSSKTYLK